MIYYKLIIKISNAKDDEGNGIYGNFVRSLIHEEKINDEKRYIESIFSTFEDWKDVKLTVCNFSQSVKVYIILLIFGEFNPDKLNLIKEVHPSNIKSKVVKGSLKLILNWIISVFSGI